MFHFHCQVTPVSSAQSHLIWKELYENGTKWQQLQRDSAMVYYARAYEALQQVPNLTEKPEAFTTLSHCVAALAHNKAAKGAFQQARALLDLNLKEAPPEATELVTPLLLAKVEVLQQQHALFPSDSSRLEIDDLWDTLLVSSPTDSLTMAKVALLKNGYLDDLGPLSSSFIDSTIYVRSLFAKAKALIAEKKKESALSILQQLIDLNQPIPIDAESLVKAYNLMAKLHFGFSDYEKMMQYCLAAAEVGKRIFSGEYLLMTETLKLLGVAYYLVGKL